MITIKNNLIFENNTEGSCWDESGIEISGNLDYIEISNNTIVENICGIKTGSGTGTPSIYNCIFWNNSDSDIEGSGATYSCIEESFDVNDPNFIGSINSNPCFVDDANDNYHILSTSPCINAGDPNGSYAGQADIDGDNRVIGDDVDMGTDEYDSNWDIRDSIQTLFGF